MSLRRLRPTRSALLLTLVVVLLGTIPVLVPLLVTQAAGSPGPTPVAAATAPSASALPVPAVPVQGTTPASEAATRPAATTAAPSPTAASSTPPATTAAPSPPAPAPRTADPTPMPTTPSPTAAQPRVQVAAADLVVVSVSWSPERPAPGEAVTFSAVIRNTGTVATPDRTHGVGFLVDGEKVTWSAGSTAPLAPGEERTYTADGGVTSATWLATEGPHTIQARADDPNQIEELSKANNTTKNTLNIR